MSNEILNAEQQKIYEEIKDAYIFTYPLVQMVLYSRAKTNTVKANSERAPYNQFLHNKNVWTPEERKPGGPNMDTVYSFGVLKLEKDALVLHKPKTDRFYTILFLDGYGDFREIIGSGGLGGREEGDYFITGPAFEGIIPEGFTHVEFPTSLVSVLLRVQIFLNSDNDIENVRKYQKGTYFVPYESYGKDYTFPDGEYNPEYDYNFYFKMKELDAESYFTIFNEYSIANPIVPEDIEYAAKFEKYGIKPGGKFSLSQFKDEALIQKIKTIPQTVKLNRDEMGFNRNGWEYFSIDTPLPGSDYYERAFSIHWGPGCNPAKASLYPQAELDKDGNQLNGKYKYVIHLDADAFPPVKEDGYWSFSVYTLDDLYLIENREGIYKVSSAENDFVYNSDGSLDIFIQRDAPDESKRANWLPVGDEVDFEVCLRIYIPDETAIDGRWLPPFIERVN